MATNWERYSAACGLAGVVVFAIGAFAAPLPPSTDDPVGADAIYYHQHLGAIRVQLFLTGIAGILLLWFLGSLAAHLRRAEGENARLTWVALGGSLVGVAMIGVGTVAAGVLVHEAARAPGVALATPREPLSPLPAYVMALTGFRALADVRWIAYTLSWFAFAPVLVAVAVLAYRHSAFPRWHANFGYALFFVALAAGAGIVVSSGPFAPGGALSTIAMLAFLVWLGLTSAVVAGWTPTTAERRDEPGPPPPAPAG